MWNSTKDYDRLSNQNEKLIAEKENLKTSNKKLSTELNECQNGAEKIIARVIKAYSVKDYSTAKENIGKLSERHPESEKNKEFEKLLEKIKKEEWHLEK